MKQVVYTIKDEIGIHARPAGQLVTLAKQYESNIILEKNDNKVDLKRLMSVLGLGVKQGDLITIQAEGNDEEEAVKEIKKYLENNL